MKEKNCGKWERNWRTATTPAPPNECDKDKKIWKMQICSNDLENLCSKLL